MTAPSSALRVGRSAPHRGLAGGLTRRRPPVAGGLALVAASLALVVLAISSPWSTHGRPAAPLGRIDPGGDSLTSSLSSLPPSARAPISGTLGEASSAYRIRAGQQALSARNPAQGMRMTFSPSGVSVARGPGQVRLRLRAVGYRRSLAHVAAVVPRAGANRVIYEHPTVTEWYVNGPLGLEQGFRIKRAPAGRFAGPLTLSVGLSAGARVSRAPAGGGLVLEAAGGHSLRYDDLRVRDARGRALHSWLEPGGGGLLIRVDAHGARYPLTIDPFVQQDERLIGEGAVGDPAQGFSVALSANGSTALVGGPSDRKYAGAAWVFTRAGATWTQQGSKLTGGKEAGKGEFGRSVALSADGDTALIGGEGDNGFAGAAWVFIRSGSTWSQQGQKLTGGGESGNGSLGFSVALSDDGDVALIGGIYDNKGAGAAWVFARSGSSWTQQGAKLTGGGESGEGLFGFRTAISSDGSTAIVTGVGDGNTGAAWVFTRSGSSWTQQGMKLTGVGAAGGGGFGAGVAFSGDGDTALVGSLSDDAAWVFTRSGSSWSQQGEKLSGAGETGNALFGWSVALSAEGDTAVIGGTEDDGGAGAAWVFTRSGSSWTQQGAKLTGGGESGAGAFGTAVALSGDGNTALVGGPADDELGAAWVFVTPPAVTKLKPKKGTTSGGTVVTITGANFAGATAVDFGTVAAASFNVASASSITAVSPPEPAGKVDVRVTTPAGTSGVTAKDRFKFRT